MRDFREKILNIAERKKHTGNKRLISSESNSMSFDLNEVMNILYDKTESGVNVYNEVSEGGELSIFRLPEELLQVFLNVPGKQIGFCLMSDIKFVLFIGEVPNEVIVLGKKRQSYGNKESFLARAIQLIRIKFEQSGNMYSYRDNTGSLIDPEEIIIHIINWAVT